MNERAIFDAALEIPDPDRRRACLDQLCGADAVLRARIEALLESHEVSSQFLNVPAVEQFKSSAAPTGQPTMMHPKDAGHGLLQDDESDGELAMQLDLSFLSPSSKPDSIGTLGHYEILQVLGQGAFGIVFKAFDEKLHRLVAIKVLNPQMASTSPPRKRFLREARSAAAIRHENIVQVYSVEEQPLPYLVMEYIDGQTLQQKLDGTGPLDVPEILQIGRQLAAGLAVAHAKGLIHRDIKPGNILLEKGAEQRVKITDFGLARAADDASLTRTGLISGTPMYMAPEQANGAALDHRADLFSLGSVLYVMASGRPPFRADKPVAVLKRVTDETPRLIQEIIPEVPDWLCAIITTLHCKKREDRFQSAQEVADLLARCQSELEHHGRVQSLGGVLPIVSKAPNATKSESPASETAPEKAIPALESQPSRSHRWIALAATILVLIVGLGLTEATGFTNFQGAVIHLFSPSGTPGSESVADLPPEQVRIEWHGEVTEQSDFNAPKNSGFVPLFNGKDLEGWVLRRRPGATNAKKPDDFGTWKIERGILAGRGPGNLLLSKRDDFENFHLRAEAKLNWTSNSGIQFRHQRGKAYHAEMSLHDDPRYPSKTGSLTGTRSCDRHIPENLIVADQWFTYEVIAEDNHIVIKVNGQVTVDVRDENREFTRGRLALEAGGHAGGTVQFRKIEIQELPPSTTP